MRRLILLCLTCVLFPETPSKRVFFMYSCTCVSPFIMSYCRRIVILTFIFHDSLRVSLSYSLLDGLRGDVRVVSLMVNGYADIYKDKTWKHLRTHTISNGRSIITTGLHVKLFRISMLSTDPALSTVAGERGGSVVECRTPEREVRGSKPTAAVLCPWARHFTPRKYWLLTQEAMAPSRYDWKIVDWDVKPQHNQPTTVAVKPKVTAFKTPSNHDKCYYWYCILHWLTWQLYLAIHSVFSKYI